MLSAPLPPPAYPRGVGGGAVTPPAPVARRPRPASRPPPFRPSAHALLLRARGARPWRGRRPSGAFGCLRAGAPPPVLGATRAHLAARAAPLVPPAPAPRTMPRTAFPRAMPPASPAPFAGAASGGRVRGLLAPAPPRAVRSVCRGGAAAVGAAAVGRVRQLDPELRFLSSGHPNPWSNLVSFSRAGAAAVGMMRQLDPGFGFPGSGHQNPWSNLVSFFSPTPPHSP